MLSCCNLMGPTFFEQKTNKIILKKINPIECLVTVWFLYIKGPINVGSHLYKLTNKDRTYFSKDT